MSALAKAVLLFVLNWLDAQLTLVWIHSHIATEGNGLLAPILQLGDTPFMLVKLLVGAFAAYVLYRCAHFTLARRGMQIALTVYMTLMLAHLATGMAALGWPQPLATVDYVSNLPSALLTILF
jgi:Domain of unknown function (DUF5658)